MGNQQPYNGDPAFVPKARAAWKNWLIAALVLGASGVLLLFLPSDGTIALPLMWVGTLICLVGAGVSALMKRR